MLPHVSWRTAGLLALTLALTGCYYDPFEGEPETALRLLVTIPADNDQDVSRTRELHLQFTGDLDPEQSGIVLTPADPADIRISGRDIFVRPKTHWSRDTEYTWDISAYSLEGLEPVIRTLRFTTGSTPRPDSEIPAEVEFRPQDAASDVKTTEVLELRFSHAMDRASVEQALSITPPVACTWQWTSNGDVHRATCTPEERLQLSTQYTVRLGTTARRAVGGAPLSEEFVSRFTTFGPPALTSTSPMDGERGVYRYADVILRFSRAMDCASLQQAFRLNGSSGPVAGTFECYVLGETNAYAFSPSGGLPHGQQYEWALDVTAKDSYGYPIAAPGRGTFTIRRVATVILAALPDGDGTVSEGGNTALDGAALQIGQREGLGEAVSFLTFDLTELPDNAQSVIAATLRAQQTLVVGSPYSQRGNLFAESVAVGPVDAGDFSAPTKTYRSCNIIFQCHNEPIRSVLSSSSTTGPRSTNVSQAVSEDFRARQATSQFRLRFLGTPGSSNEYVEMASASASSGAPTLEVTYEYP